MPASSARVLVLNAGSSSLKFALRAAPAEVGLTGQFEFRDGAVSLVRCQGAGAEALSVPAIETRRHDFAHVATEQLLGALASAGQTFDAVGHRVVHGGRDFRGAVRVDAAVREALAALTALAPLHQPAALAAIDTLTEEAPAVPQFAAFDTAFHRTLGPVQERLPIPLELHELGVQRYGFHGLAYESVARQLGEQVPALAAGRVVAAHLGSGCSLCALAGGISVDTTCGFSTLGGLPMSTRAGDLDPGVLTHLVQTLGWDGARLDEMLNHESGLLGLSGGLAADMRELLASDAPAARLAVDAFVSAVAKGIAAMVTTLGGLDGLVFSGGIGEHAAPVRAAVVARLGFLGLRADPGANESDAADFTGPGSSAQLRITPADEQAAIDRAVRRLLKH